MDQVTRSGSTRRARLGRRLSRRLSLVARVPNILGSKIRQEFGSRDSLATHGKSHYLTVIAPDKSQRIIQGESPETVSQLLSKLALEFGIDGWPEVKLAGSQAEVDPDADVALLEAEILIVETKFEPEVTDDSVRDLCITWMLSEQKHVSRLRCCVPLYGSPLTQLGVLSSKDFGTLCQPIAALAETCNIAVIKMKELLDNWNTGRDMIFQVFNDKFWDQYEIYQRTYRNARQLIREKSREDDDFVELCKLRKGAAKYGIMDILDLPLDTTTRSPTAGKKLLLARFLIANNFWN